MSPLINKTPCCGASVGSSCSGIRSWPNELHEWKRLYSFTLSSRSLHRLWNQFDVTHPNIRSLIQFHTEEETSWVDNWWVAEQKMNQQFFIMKKMLDGRHQPWNIPDNNNEMSQFTLWFHSQLLTHHEQSGIYFSDSLWFILIKKLFVLFLHL